ncbi:hypothetical protein F5Y14DRAFT_451758 [Nemania sp. NC0429]|nr:hypothetical protein F5Y14DRAFT_451758 [Nemania sp. NC0429]
MLLQMDTKDDSPSSDESDNSSDYSNTSWYERLEKFMVDKAPFTSQSSALTSIQDTIASLRQLSLTSNRAGTKHRQEQIHAFGDTKRNDGLFEKCARQQVDYLFPKASEKLRTRMVESIRARWSRFLYLHQEKTSTLHEPSQEPQRHNVTEERHTIAPGIEQKQKQGVGSAVVVRPSEVLSSTVIPKLDPKPNNCGESKSQCVEFVSPVKNSAGMLPSMPKLHPGETSVTCPHCSLVCRVKGASGQDQWMNHLIHDFEPLFCVFDDCLAPFLCADTYTGWLAHMRDTHTRPKWHCSYCKTDSLSSSPFDTPTELENHLEKHHQVTESLRPTLVSRSMIRDQHALEECPFCGGFPEEVEKDYPDRDSEQAREALDKHVRDHLVSVALILAPLEIGEATGQRHDTHESVCQNNSYDCKKSSDFDCAGNEDPNITKLWENVSGLEHKDPDVRNVAIWTLATEPSLPKTMIRAIATKFEHRNPNTRQVALLALRDRPDLSKTILRRIVALLRDDSSAVRQTTTTALMTRPDLSETILQAIAANLEDENVHIRRAAIQALNRKQKLLPETILEAILAKVEDEDILVQYYARYILEIHNFEWDLE